MNSIIGVAVVAGLGAMMALYPRVALPSHLLQHTCSFQQNLIPPELGIELNNLIRELKVYPSNLNADLKTGGFVTKHESIGEGMAIESDGSCSHPYLVPNMHKTECVLPQRVDVGRHFVSTGGVDGLRENHDQMVARVSSFGKYMFGNATRVYPSLEKLFNTGAFQSAAKVTCPIDKQVLDTFQVNFIMQVPGQTVALHLDAPYFWGATRMQFPQWLLVCMVFSNLFKEKFVDQVQIVGYLHSDGVNDPNDPRAGDFIYFPDNSGKYVTLPSLSLAGISVDGSKTVHAANTYKPRHKLPLLSKDKDINLVYAGNEQWHLQADNLTLQVYPSSDLRISTVFRARCFASEGEMQAYHQQLSDPEKLLSLEDILSVFEKDLRARGVWTAGAAKSRLTLALLLMDTYIKYPLPSASAAFFPFNYCALGKMYPQLLPVLSLIC